MYKSFEEIYNYVKGLEIIDTHEHLPYSEEAREKDTDVLKEYLIHYFSSDLISAGLGPEAYQKAISSKLPFIERWKLVEPYWEVARNTGYGRSLDISVKALYGIEKISGSTIEELNKMFLESLKPGHYKKVLKEKSKIKISLLNDNNLNCDKSFFRTVYCLDNFIYPRTIDDIKAVEREVGFKICSLDDWLEACGAILDKVLNLGVVALKCALAYVRTLNFERVAKSDAENDFNEMLKVLHFPGRENRILINSKKCQDYMMHFILRLANKKNITYQFHTGMHEGNGNLVYNSNPVLLSNLFLEYSDIDFDIFHAGYPYQHVVSALAKMFPNVYIDMCWIHIISPTASINALEEWLDSVPANKISAFGGDYCFIDGVYGHQHLTRLNVSKCLAKKVDENIFEIEEAKEISEMLFYNNPFRIYKLKGKITP